MDRNSQLGGSIGCGDSFLEFTFYHFKFFVLHEKPRDAGGAVRAQSRKGRGYCGMIGRGSISSLLGHAAGLLFCLYLKLFLPSIFKSVGF